jgi:HSP20 family protein
VGWVDEGDALSAEVAIPPALADDVDVTLDGRTICVRAARRRSASRPLPRGGIAVQSAWGAFERRITAPRGVDLGAASATLEQGRMRIRLPKRPASAPRSIPIRTAA